MRFNLELGAGEYRHADVLFIGHIAKVSLWMGDPINSVESQYQMQFGDDWVAKGDLEKAHDAIRVAIADALDRGFDPFPVELLPERSSPRWVGRILDLSNPQQ
ncbi:hypothetical protein [Duganella levis]|uniref:Uncharacterized protein n=1 Tax=Duganella levis TaxID=2692169 RepID=A0ABW9W5I1_9BURK|nr:hypothetical protein [Duganella levis]MYN29211.1 hypothetical protein [Duganella levis]